MEYCVVIKAFSDDGGGVSPREEVERSVEEDADAAERGAKIKLKRFLVLTKCMYYVLLPLSLY